MTTSLQFRLALILIPISLYFLLSYTTYSRSDHSNLSYHNPHYANTSIIYLDFEHCSRGNRPTALRTTTFRSTQAMPVPEICTNTSPTQSGETVPQQRATIQLSFFEHGKSLPISYYKTHYFALMYRRTTTNQQPQHHWTDERESGPTRFGKLKTSPQRTTAPAAGARPRYAAMLTRTNLTNKTKTTTHSKCTLTSRQDDWNAYSNNQLDTTHHGKALHYHIWTQKLF